MAKKVLQIMLVVFFFSTISPLCGISRGGEFPTRSIELIIPYAPGGPSDIMGRSLTPKLGEVLGQPVIPINKPGASGALGMTLLAKGKPDGYTILIASTSNLIVAPNFEKVGYDVLKDFTFVCKLYNQPNTMIVVRPDAPWKNIEELLDDARKNPKKIKYGTPGQFSGGHIAMEAIGKEKSIEWVHIPFKGDGPSSTALLGGHIDCAIIFAAHIPLIKTGRLRSLVTVMSRRSPNFPEIPCLKDVGIKFEGKGSSEAISGIMAPKGLPNDILKKYEGALKETIKSEEFLRACNTLWLDPHLVPGDDFRKEVEDSYKYIGELGKKLGFK